MFCSFHRLLYIFQDAFHSWSFDNKSKNRNYSAKHWENILLTSQSRKTRDKFSVPMNSVSAAGGNQTVVFKSISEFK